MKHDEMFERLAPPPGGLVRLRARLDARPRAARPVAMLAFAAALAALVLVWVGSRGAFDPVAAARLHADAPEIALGLAPAPAAAVAIDDDARATTALAEVPTANPKVAFYWVSSTTWRE